MARLQILELPEGSGDDRAPFVLVLDQMPTDEADFEALRRDLNDDVAQRIGARAILAFETTINIPANDVPADPDGYPGKLRIEPDFETFRAQIQEEILYARAQITQPIGTQRL